MPKSMTQYKRLVAMVAIMKQGRVLNRAIFRNEADSSLIEPGTPQSDRTLSRDIKFLISELHAPIEYDYEERGYKLKDLNWKGLYNFADEDMQAVVIAARLAELMMPAPLRGTITQTVNQLILNNDTGFEKETNLQALLTMDRQRVHINPEVVNAVFAGWKECHALKLVYQRPGQLDSNKIVLPHALVERTGVWYIKGEIIESDGIRKKPEPITVMALHRMKNVEVMNKTFARDKKIVAEVEAGKLFDFGSVNNVKVWCSAEIAVQVKEQLAYWKEEIEENGDGSIFLFIPQADPFQLMKWVLSERGNAAIVEPADYAIQVLQAAKSVVEVQKKLCKQHKSTKTKR